MFYFNFKLFHLKDDEFGTKISSESANSFNKSHETLNEIEKWHQILSFYFILNNNNTK